MSTVLGKLTSLEKLPKVNIPVVDFQFQKFPGQVNNNCLMNQTKSKHCFFPDKNKIGKI